MKRREIYRLVAEFAAVAGSREALLGATVGAMRMIRGLGDSSSALALAMLNSPLRPILERDDALGEIYQASNAPALDRAYRATARERRKFSDDEIPSVTQLFTPRFVVEFLLENTLRNSVVAWASRPRAGGLSRERAGETPTPRLIRNIRILDPACGTMNFGLVAIDMMQEMYRTELAQLGPESASVSNEDDIPRSILKHNLFGIDIDPTALELAAQTLSMKLRLPIEECRENLWLGDALFDKDPAARCAGAFDVVVTNPPYLSARNLDPKRVARIKRKYPASWRDAYACFIERSLEFVKDGGRVGILAMQSFMFTGAFQKLREKLAEIAAIEAIAHFGPGLFEIGNPGTLQTAAVVLRREPDASRREQNEVTALRLVDEVDKAASLRVLQKSSSVSLVIRGEGSSVRATSGNAPSPQPSPCVQGEGVALPLVFKLSQRDLLSSPRSAWVYWLSPRLRQAFERLPKLRTIAPPRQGLATTNNARFVRYWWEVEPTRDDAPCRASQDTWFPYVKSGRFRRWFEPPRHRVNWAGDGGEIKEAIVERYPYLNGRWEWVAKNSQFYGRGGVTYSYLTAGAFSARLMPAGAIFDVAGSAIFPDDELTLLAILNSSTATELLHAVNPTVNFQVGDLAELPLPCRSDDELRELAQSAVDLQTELDATDETSPQFAAPAPWDGSDHSRIDELSKLEAQIDRQVAELYGISAFSPRVYAGAEPRVDAGAKRELAARWVSFAIGRLLGRWGCDREYHAIQIRPACDRTVARIRAELVRLLGSRFATEVEHSLGSIGRFVAGPFYAWHVKLYRSRPVYWLVGDARRATLVLHDFAMTDVLSQFTPVPEGWERNVDDGILVNLAPLSGSIRDSTLCRKLKEIRSDFETGRYDWSKTRAGTINPASNAESAPARDCRRSLSRAASAARR